MSWCFGLFWDLFLLLFVALFIFATDIAIVIVLSFGEGCFQYLPLCCREPKPAVAVQQEGRPDVSTGARTRTDWLR